MKLWSVKNSECLKSLEVSDDDATVWALAVSTKEDHIITGASNSTLILWKVTSPVCRHRDCKTVSSVAFRAGSVLGCPF